MVLLERESNTLFSGDNVLGVGTTVFRDLTAYMRSLYRMRELVAAREVTTIFPAHGPVVMEAVTKLDEYIAHRNARINQVEAALSSRRDAAATCEEITRSIYTEQPASLLPAAGRVTMLVLQKLLADGKAQRVERDGQWWWSHVNSKI